MKIGVPGEFHEDRWQRTAEDLREACVSAHTGRGRCHPDTSYRVPKRPSGRSSARRVGPQVLQGHPGVTKRGFWTVFGTATLPTGTSGASRRGKGGFWTVFGTATPPIGAPEASRRGEGGSSFRPLARLPCPQVPNCYPRGVHKQSADG